MPKLFIYGDSYSNSTKFETWPKLVADGLNYELVNSAVPGSSTEYSFLKWSNDVKEHTFAPNDKIIFVISSPGRLHFEYQLFADPSSGSRFTFQNLDTKDSKNFWHTANKDKIRWYLQHRSLELNQLTHEAYLNTFKVFAFENPTIDFLALNNSHYENILNLNIEPSNFFHPKISLQEVSSNEQVQKNMEFLEWAKYTRFDARNITNSTDGYLISSASMPAPTSPAGLYCVQSDGTILPPDCSSNQNNLFYIQAGRTSINGSGPKDGYRLAVRVYRKDIDFEKTVLANTNNTKNTQAVVGSGNKQAPLVEIIADIANNNTSFTALCNRLGFRAGSATIPCS